MSADTNHLHHLLQRLMPKLWVVISIWLMVAVPGLVSMAMPSWTLAAVLTVTALYIGLLLWASRRSQDVRYGHKLPDFGKGPQGKPASVSGGLTLDGQGR